MGFYAKIIFPWGMNRVLSKPQFTAARKALLSEVGAGEVLEIGFGTGLNLPHYPPHVARIAAIEVNEGMDRHARSKRESSPIPVTIHRTSGETLPFGDSCFDAAVSTWTLCSISDPVRALREVGRVLKPGGRFFFLEHGLSSDPGVARWQHRLNGLHGLYTCGCNLNRDIKGLVSAAGFTLQDLREFYMPDVRRTDGYTYQGVARIAGK